jgi:hypothetical protein
MMRVNLIHLIHDRDERQNLVNIVMNFEAP